MKPEIKSIVGKAADVQQEGAAKSSNANKVPKEKTITSAFSQRNVADMVSRRLSPEQREDPAVLTDAIENLVERPTVSIAAWNIRIFSDNSRDDQELMMIADILVNYDFIAIVEVRDERVLMRTESLLQGMGRDYDYLISPPVGATVKERYAFLFDSERVNVIEDGEVFPDPNDVFLREPYYATFRAGLFDFTAIATHVVYGKLVGPRQKEVQELAKVFQAVQSADASEQDVILLGRFQS